MDDEFCDYYPRLHSPVWLHIGALSLLKGLPGDDGKVGPCKEYYSLNSLDHWERNVYRMASLLRSRDHVQHSASSLERPSLPIPLPKPTPQTSTHALLHIPPPWRKKKNQSTGKHSNPKEKGNENVLICPKSPDANVVWARNVWLELQCNKINDTPVVEGSCPWGWGEIYSICLLSPAPVVSYEGNGKDWSGHKFGVCRAEEFGAWSIFQQPLEATHHHDMQPTRQIKRGGDFWSEAEPRCSWLTVEGYFALVESLQVTFDFPSASDLLLKCPITPITQSCGKEL